MTQGRKTADERERAAIAEEEVRRLTSGLSRQKEEAELQHYRALAVQQEKWEVREKRLEQQLQETMARGERLEAACRSAGVRRRRVPVLQRGITPSQPGEHRDWRLLESREVLRLSSNALRLCLEVSN